MSKAKPKTLCPQCGLELLIIIRGQKHVRCDPFLVSIVGAITGETYVGFKRHVCPKAKARKKKSVNVTVPPGEPGTDEVVQPWLRPSGAGGQTVG